MDNQSKPTQPADILEKEFVHETRDKFSPLQSEIAARNKQVQENDQYIYGDLIERSLNVPLGHDFTPVNWLRRTVEIHRSQFIGKGFGLDSTYLAQDLKEAPVGQDGQPDKDAVERIKIENDKRKSYAEARRTIIEQILRDNGADGFWGSVAENASATGDSIIKAWYDPDQKKYRLQLIEIVDYFYALWNKDDYRSYDAVAYIYQISKQEAVRDYGVDENVATSPLGTPLAVLSSSATTQYVTTQPMVTVMEVTGKIQGWKTNGKGKLQKCKVGEETEINAIIVGDRLYQLIDDPGLVPHYYILPNKRARRRPWGIADITKAAININMTYVETLSDWRTLASKVNFPKWKGFGFPLGVQVPKPKPRTVEILPMAAGQDLQPLAMGQGAQLGETDFPRQLDEMKSEFVREVGVSRQLFDLPDQISNSKQAMITGMQSISDITVAKRKLWEPIITKIFEDALEVLGHHLPAVKNLLEGDDDWHIKINWPSALNADDPAYHAMQLNRFMSGTMSVQSFLESMGEDKQEIDRIREEMEDSLTAAIHGKGLGELAHFKIYQSLGVPLWGFNQPKISLKGDLTPQQEGNMASLYGWNDGPFGASIGPQGLEGERANENVINQGFSTQNPYSKYGMPTGIQPGQDINPQTAAAPGAQGGNLPPGNAPAGQGAGMQPMGGGGLINPGGMPNGVMSQPGTGAPAASPKGKLKKHNQNQGG